MNLPAMQEITLWFPGLKDPLAEEIHVSVQFSLVAQPGFPFHHQLPELN